MHLLKTKKELKSLCRQEIQILFTETISIKLVVVYGKTKDLANRTQSDKVLTNKAFIITSDTKDDGYQRGLGSIVYKFFDKKSSGSGITNEPNYQLINELHKPIIKKIKKRKVYSSFIDNIWGFDLADMQ